MSRLLDHLLGAALLSFVGTSAARYTAPSITAPPSIAAPHASTSLSPEAARAEAIFRIDGPFDAYRAQQLAALPDHTSREYQMLETGYRRGGEITQRVLAALDLKPGENVADIGCGQGYDALRFAALVHCDARLPRPAGVQGPRGQVYAADVNPDCVDFLRQRLQEVRQQLPELPTDNIIPYRSRPDDCLLPSGALDAANIGNAHFFARPARGTEWLRCLQSIHRALKPEGRLLVTETMSQPASWALERDDLDPTQLVAFPIVGAGDQARMRIPLESLLQRFKLAGFRLAHRYDFNEGHHVLLLKKQDPAASCAAMAP